MLNHAQNPEITVTPQKLRFTCGFPCAGAVGQNGFKTFFKIGGYWDEKIQNVNKLSGVSVYNARAAQGLLMGRAAKFSQLNGLSGFATKAPAPLRRPCISAYCFFSPIKNRALPVVSRFLPPLTYGYFFTPIKIWGLKRLTCGFTKSQRSDLRVFLSPNKTPFRALGLIREAV